MKKKVFILIISSLVIICQTPLYSQEVPHPVTNTGIYEFLDELAGMQIIEINSASQTILQIIHCQPAKGS